MADDETDLVPNEDATAYLQLAYGEAPWTETALAYSVDPVDDHAPTLARLTRPAAAALRTARPYLLMFGAAVVTVTAILFAVLGGPHRAVNASPVTAAPSAQPPTAAAPAAASPPPPAAAPKPAPPPPSPAPDTADRPWQRPSAAADDQYLQALAAAGISTGGNRTGAIEDGRLICTGIGNGVAVSRIEDEVRNTEKGLAAAGVSVFVRIAVDSYCPQYSFLLPSGS